jgi:hypothetical protein
MTCYMARDAAWLVIRYLVMGQKNRTIQVMDRAQIIIMDREIYTLDKTIQSVCAPIALNARALVHHLVHVR